MATITIGPTTSGLVEKTYIAWIGPTTTINSTNFSWYTSTNVAGIYGISANRQGYISNKPSAQFPAVTQFQLAPAGSLPYVYELDLKAQITLDTSQVLLINPANQLPTVSFAPNNSTPPSIGALKQFTAQASDPDGTIAKVELVTLSAATGGTVTSVLDTDTSSPYVLGWTPSTSGTFYLAVRATDNSGGQTVSGTLSLDVAASTVKRRVAIIRVGTSITRADGATIAAGFRPADTYNAASPYQTAQGAKANEGRQTSVEKAVDLYLTPQFGANYEFTAIPLGYPSMTSAWYTDNHLATAFNGLSQASFDDILVLPEWGANDAADMVQSRETGLPADSAAEVHYHAQQFKAMSSKVKVIASPCLNRDNYSKYVNFKVWRYLFNQLLYADNIFDEVVNSESFPFGQDAAPQNFSSSNASGTYFFDNAGHLNGNGTTDDGLAEAQAVARLFGLTLSQGNGSRPVADPVTSLSVSPVSGNSSTTRTVTATTSIAPTLVEFYAVNASGITYAPTKVGSDSTAPYNLGVTPASLTTYYARLTSASGKYTYSTFATATIISSAPTTRTLDFTKRQVYFEPQPDGTLLKTSGPDAGHYAQASGDAFVPAGNTDNILLSFVMPPLTGGGGDFLLGFSALPVPLDANGNVDGNVNTISTIDKVMFYANDTVGRVFITINGSSGIKDSDFARPAPGDNVTIEKRSDGYYFTNVTQNISYPTIPANGATGGVPTGYLTSKHVVNAVGSTTNQSRIPVVSITATAFGLL